MKVPVILGTGPSLARDIETIKHLHQADKVMLFGINDTYRDFNLDVWIACDPKWHQVRGRVEIPYCDQWHWDKTICDRGGYMHIEGVWKEGMGLWTKDTEAITLGHSSGWQALNLAHHYVTWGLCSGPILLCGYDMTYPEGQPRHYFKGVSETPGEYDKALRKWSLFDKGSGQGLLYNYRDIARQTDRHEIINCTPGSAMTWFPIRSIDSLGL